MQAYTPFSYNNYRWGLSARDILKQHPTENNPTENNPTTWTYNFLIKVPRSLGNIFAQSDCPPEEDQELYNNYFDLFKAFTEASLDFVVDGKINYITHHDNPIKYRPQILIVNVTTSMCISEPFKKSDTVQIMCGHNKLRYASIIDINQTKSPITVMIDGEARKYKHTQVSLSPQHWTIRKTCVKAGHCWNLPADYHLAPSDMNAIKSFDFRGETLYICFERELSNICRDQQSEECPCFDHVFFPKASYTWKLRKPTKAAKATKIPKSMSASVVEHTTEQTTEQTIEHNAE